MTDSRHGVGLIPILVPRAETGYRLPGFRRVVPRGLAIVAPMGIWTFTCAPM